MHRRLPSQDADIFPLDVLLYALFHEFADLLDGHLVIGMRLSAGPVAITATDIAVVGDIDLNFIPPSLESGSQKHGHGL
jgi:hypothetical protein